MAGRFSVEAVFKAVDRVTAPVTRMQNRVGKFTRGMEKGLRRANRATGKFFGGLKKGAIAASVALALTSAAIADVVNVGADFGRAIGSAASKFPEQIQRGTDAFRELEESARAVGRTTEFTSVQAAQGLNFLAKAGFSAEFSMKALPEIIDFTTASEIEFAEAADIASDALGAFGLNSTDSAKRMTGLKRVMDVMGKTANSANVVVGELFESVKKSAPVATKAGVSIETYAATMGILAKNGIKAAEAGTAAKNVTLSLAGIGFKAAKTFKVLGISIVDTNGGLRDQLDVLDDLRVKLGGLTKQKQLGVIDAIFGKRSLATAAILLSDAGKEVRGLRKELEAAQGSNKKIAAFIRDDVKGSLDSFKSAVESVKLSIFSLREGELKKLIDGWVLWIRANEKLIATRIDKFITKVANAIAFLIKHGTAIKRIIAVVAGLIIAMKILVGVLTVMNLLLIPITGTGLLIAAAIGLIIAAVAVLVIWVIKMKDSIAEAFGKINPIIQLNIQVLKAFFSIIKAKFSVFIAFIKGVFDIWVAVHKAAFSIMLAIVKNMPLAQLIMDNWEPIKGFFVELWGGVASVFESVFARISVIVNKITKFAGKIKAISGGIAGGITDFGDRASRFISGDAGDGGPQVVSPQDRTARRIEERRSFSSAEVTIRDDTGRAEVTDGALGAGLTLVPSGAF